LGYGSSGKVCVQQVWAPELIISTAEKIQRYFGFYYRLTVRLATVWKATSIGILEIHFYELFCCFIVISIIQKGKHCTQRSTLTDPIPNSSLFTFSIVLCSNLGVCILMVLKHIWRVSTFWNFEMDCLMPWFSYLSQCLFLIKI
jgi:hypothetical protein